MASRQALYPPRAAHPEAIIIAGSFAPDGSNNPAAASQEGPIGTVTHTATGTYLVTLKDQWAGLLAVIPSAQVHSGHAVVVAGDIDLAAKTCVVRVYQESTGALAAVDLTANANTRINLLFVFRNTSLQVKA